MTDETPIDLKLLKTWIDALKETVPTQAFELLEKTLKSAQEALDSQKIQDATQKLTSIRQQLEGLLNAGGKENPDVRRALDTLNQITITDAPSASAAESAIIVGTQAGQEAGAEQLTTAITGGLSGLAALAASPEVLGAMRSFGKSLMPGDYGQETLTAAALFTSLNHGINQHEKSKATGIVV